MSDATEIAKKCLDFEELKIEKIVGRALKENIDPTKVLEKIGMKFKENFDFEGREGVLYEIKGKESSLGYDLDA